MRKFVDSRNAICAVTMLATLACPVVAQSGTAAADYPSRPIMLVVPYPPGGGVDTMARVIAAKLSDALKRQVVVKNQGGGGGIIGTRAVARAEPDGYTLLLGHTGTISIDPSLYANAGYDPRKDFAPIGMVASIPVALLAHPSFPAKSVAEFITLAKQQPGKLNVGAGPVGTGGYMCAELFKSVTGVDVAIIPFNGTASVINDLLGAHVPIAFGVLAPALGNIQAGRLRAIAVSSAKRSILMPDVPTFNESGLPGFEVVEHYGLLAPAGTPKEIVDVLSVELRKLVNTDDVKQRIYAEGGDPVTSTPAEYASDIDKEETKWSILVHKLGLKVE
jgi:tripartite-type tricarboxylate transporter receptor subunit TctC